MDKLLNRINELAKKAKTEGLTEEEKQEQLDLRQQYLQNFRGSMNDILLNSTVIDPDGTDVTPEKLKQAQREMHLRNAQVLMNPEESTEN